MINRTLDIGRDIVLLFVACSTFSSMFSSLLPAQEPLTRSGSAFKKTSLGRREV